MPTPLNLTGITDPNEILRLMRQAGKIQGDVRSPTEGGGEVVYPGGLTKNQQDSMAQQNLASQATKQSSVVSAQQPGGEAKGPMLNGMPWAQGQAALQGQTQGSYNQPANFNMDSYLTGKFGASAPQIRSVTSNTSLNGAGNGDILNSLIAQMSGAQDKANAANEARYGEAKKQLSGYGKSFQSKLDTQYGQDVAAQEQQAASRGLGNSTIRNALLSQAGTRRNEANLDLADRLAQARVALLQSKSDNAPDPALLAQLIQSATQGAYGSGGNLGSISSALGLIH